MSRPDANQLSLAAGFAAWRRVKQIRVLMVTDWLQGGGAERQLALLASSLPKPWDVTVLSLADGPFRQVLEHSGVRTKVAPRAFRWDVRPAAALWDVVRTWRPAVVHTWGWMSTAAALPICRVHRIPLIDGSIRLGHLPRRRGRIQRYLARRADVVVANSQAGLQAFGFGSYPRGRVVYNGFDATRLAAITPNHSEDGVLSAVMTARMYPEKDFDTLLGAAARLGHEEPGRWRFMLIGKGPTREKLILRAKDIRGCEVLFPDLGLEVLPAVASADVGVLMTTAGLGAEGCSNTIMEYMALGLPVVCSDSGGNHEIVDDGATALLVPPGDVDALVSALRRLGADPSLRAEMGAAGLDLASAKFSLDAFVEQYTRIYHEVDQAVRM